MLDAPVDNDDLLMKMMLEQHKSRLDDGKTLVLDMNLEQYNWGSVLTSKVDALEQKSVAAVFMRIISRLLWLNVQMYTDLDDDMPCALWWSIPYDDVKDLVGDLILRQTLMHADWHNCWWCWQAAEQIDMMCIRMIVWCWQQFDGQYDVFMVMVLMMCLTEWWWTTDETVC